MLLTAVIPTYNHRKFIEETIYSALGQIDVPGLKIIVSDDCSTDGTYEISRRISDTIPNVFVRKNDQNLGVMKHYSAIADIVDTPFLAILEGDDVWIRPEKLSTQLRLHRRFPGLSVSFTACRVHVLEGGARWITPSWIDGGTRILSPIDLAYDNFVASFSNCMYVTSRFRDALAVPIIGRGYDWLLNLYLAQDSGIGFIGVPSTEYRVHAKGEWSRLSASQKTHRRRRALEEFAPLATPQTHPFVVDAIAR